MHNPVDLMHCGCVIRIVTHATFVRHSDSSCRGRWGSRACWSTPCSSASPSSSSSTSSTSSRSPPAPATTEERTRIHGLKSATQDIYETCVSRVRFQPVKKQRVLPSALLIGWLDLIPGIPRNSSSMPWLWFCFSPTLRSMRQGNFDLIILMQRTPKILD